MVRCGPQADWAQTPDHIPILLQLEVSVPSCTPPPWYTTERMDQGKFHQAVKQSINGAPPVLGLGPAYEGDLIRSSVNQAVVHL